MTDPGKFFYNGHIFRQNTRPGKVFRKEKSYFRQLKYDTQGKIFQKSHILNSKNMTREIFSILAKFSTKNMIGKIFLNGQFFDTIYDPRKFFQKCPNCQQKYDPVNLFKKPYFNNKMWPAKIFQIWPNFQQKIWPAAIFCQKYCETGKSRPGIISDFFRNRRKRKRPGLNVPP